MVISIQWIVLKYTFLSDTNKHIISQILWWNVHGVIPLIPSWLLWIQSGSNQSGGCWARLSPARPGRECARLFWQPKNSLVHQFQYSYVDCNDNCSTGTSILVLLGNTCILLIPSIIATVMNPMLRALVTGSGENCRPALEGSRLFFVWSHLCWSNLIEYDDQ